RRRCRIVLEPAFSCFKEQLRTAKFQEMTVPQILKQVLADLGPMYDRELTLHLARENAAEGSGLEYAVRDLCVQYGESSHAFAQRIMAEEGISYFFAFEGETERLVL